MHASISTKPRCDLPIDIEIAHGNQIAVHSYRIDLQQDIAVVRGADEIDRAGVQFQRSKEPV